MKLKQFMQDDDAVSPVIGVILMVAITVILAAVIASFVLGLGQDTMSTQPQASFSFDYNEDYDTGTYTASDGVLTITHDGGDTIVSDELYLRGNNIESSGPGTDWEIGLGESWADVTEHGSGTDISAGNYVVADANEDYDARIVYEAEEGDSSATLGQDSGPAA